MVIELEILQKEPLPYAKVELKEKTELLIWKGMVMMMWFGGAQYYVV
jgi:hypothetical protein